jgi:Tfp pilus assembly protein PilF
MRPLPGTVSVQVLARRPSKPARREFERGVQAWRKGHRQEAFHHIEEAVRLDGKFVEARTALGAFYAEDDQPERALEYFDGAISLDPNSARSHSAKAGVLVILNRPEEAEGAARRALQLDPQSVAAHYMLGVALWMQNRITAETSSHLEVAARKFPNARTVLAEVQAALGHPKVGK